MTLRPNISRQALNRIGIIAAVWTAYGFLMSWQAHYWLGRLYEAQKNPAGAKSEYQVALKLDSKYKPAQEALKKLGGQ